MLFGFCRGTVSGERPRMRTGAGTEPGEDPPDRLLAAHSEARRVPLCTLDRRVRAEHRFLIDESLVPGPADPGRLP